MNIFATDVCPIVSAYSLPDRLCTKMILEGYQMLSTAHRLAGNTNEELYKVTHQNHPSAVWARRSTANYMWLYNHTRALAEVFELRSGKVHSSHAKLSEIVSKPPKNVPEGDLTPFAKAMPDNIKRSVISPTEAYRKYLNVKFQEWMTRDKPLKVKFTLDIPHWIDNTTLKLIKAQEN